MTKTYKVYLFGAGGGSRFAATGVNTGPIRYGNAPGRLKDLLMRLKTRLENHFSIEVRKAHIREGYLLVDLTPEQAKEASSWPNVSKVIPQ